MTKWEYQETSEATIEELQYLGSEGWELAGVRPEPYKQWDGETAFRHTYIFKRQLPEPA